MNPQLTCSQRQWLHSSVGGASHRYCEVTGSNPETAFTATIISSFSKFMTVVQEEPSVSSFQKLCHKKRKKETWTDVACEHSCFSLLLAAREFRQEERLCLSDRNSILMTWIDVYTSKSGSHGVSNANLFDYMYLLVDYGKVLCSTANELQ